MTADLYWWCWHRSFFANGIAPSVLSPLSRETAGLIRLSRPGVPIRGLMEDGTLPRGLWLGGPVATRHACNRTLGSVSWAGCFRELLHRMFRLADPSPTETLARIHQRTLRNNRRPPRPNCFCGTPPRGDAAHKSPTSISHGQACEGPHQNARRLVASPNLVAPTALHHGHADRRPRCGPGLAPPPQHHRRRQPSHMGCTRVPMRHRTPNHPQPRTRPPPSSSGKVSGMSKLSGPSENPGSVAVQTITAAGSLDQSASLVSGTTTPSTSGGVVSSHASPSPSPSESA